MCRFTLYLGPPITLDALVTKPKNSLIHQSYESHEREEPLNGDGFGVAWYAPEISADPAVFRSISPAWSNGNLRQLARVTRSGCVLAHVRAATSGLSVSETNCHPFTAGPYAFMHNGDVSGFRKIRRRLLDSLSEPAFHAVLGSTDSEHLFGLFLDRIGAQPVRDEPGHALARALAQTIRDVVDMSRAVTDEPSYLNIAVSDGRAAVVSRVTNGPVEDADSLYWHSGKLYVCDGDVCRMIEPERGQGTVLVSSEPLSDDPGWAKVPVNHLVIIHEDHRGELVPLDRVT
jgi:ergothioneine biosynthesis protein EgtC